MNRDELVKEYEEETGNKFNVECIAYNDYALWLESKINSLTKCSNCGNMVKMITTGEICPHCYC